MKAACRGTGPGGAVVADGQRQQRPVLEAAREREHYPAAGTGLGDPGVGDRDAAAVATTRSYGACSGCPRVPSPVMTVTGYPVLRNAARAWSAIAGSTSMV